jgi:hypothetical protein
MTSTDVTGDLSPQTPQVGTVDMKPEAVTLPVSDVDRSRVSTRAWDGGWTPTSPPATPAGWPRVRPLRSVCSGPIRHGPDTDVPGFR